MICPRCSVAEISDESHRCSLCGFTPSVTAVLEPSVVDDVMQAVQRHLADRFQLVDVLRLGERSFVFRALAAPGDQTVALKVVPLDPDTDREVPRKFVRQAGLARGLAHPHIVRLHDFGATTTFLWYSMESVSHPSLARRLREHGSLPLDRCLGVLEQVASALDYAHRHGVVHGNLKPTNVFVDRAGWVRMADFGVMSAFLLPGDVSPRPGPLPEYMAPEQFFARAVGPSADQYGLAVLTYQCLTGTLPFIGDSFEEVSDLHAKAPPPRIDALRADLPPALADALERAMSKSFARRFPTVLDFVSAMSGGRPRPSLSQSVTALRPGGSGPVVLQVDNPAYRRRPLPWLVGGAFGVLVAGAFLWRVLLAPAPAPDPVVPLMPAAQAPVTAPPPPAESTPVQLPAPAPARAAAPRPAPTPRPAAPVARPAAEPGRLFVSAQPWGTLVIDGVEIGPTPVVGHVLPAGPHVIRVERPGYVPFERRVDVRAGEDLRLTGIVLEARTP